MKKISKILVLVLVAAFIVFGALNMQDQEVVKAYNTEAFKLENVHVIYNGDKELEVGDIRTSSSETAEILPDDRQITEVKISGEIFNGRKFSGTFSGLVNNDTLLTVDMDEDFSLFVTSNIDNFDY